MLALSLGYIYYCDTANRRLYRWVLAIGAVPAIAMLVVVVHTLFASRMVDELFVSLEFFAQFYTYAKDEFETCATYLYYLADDLLTPNGDTELAKAINDRLESMI